MNILKAIKNNIPNAITCCNLLSGVLASVASFSTFDEVVCGLQGYQVAFALIALGAVFDFFDGFVARLIGASSQLGGELDSLSDSVTFGLAPALVLYNMMRLANPGSLLCFGVLIIPVFGAIRLAKFNVDTTQTTTFRGLPIPSNAIFWIGFAQWYATHHTCPEWVVLVFAVALSLLMVCNLRMFSLKLHSLGLKENYRQWLLLVVMVTPVCVFGLEGLAGGIVFYVLLSAVAGTGVKV